MSTFNGEILEIPGISVDEFTNVSQKCYFLSHCHSDHMRGLSSLKTEAPLYTTAISALIVSSKCPQLRDNMKILEIGVATSIDLPPDDSGLTLNFVVTALSAGHCPGSCMLLFQIEEFDILYTGDFRISMKNLQQVKLFDTIRSHSNAIIYLDSTFMKTSFPNFPSQTESVKTIVELVDDHLKRGRNNKVNLLVPARYGYEYLLMELSSKLNEKTYIEEREVFSQVYLMVSRLNSCVTMNKDKARIFLKQTFITSSILPEKNDVYLNLQLSAMYWANWNHGSIVRQTGENSFRVCYATHSSLSEITSFLTYVKPKKVYLNVLPGGVERVEMFNQLALIQKQYTKDEYNPNDQPEGSFSTKRKFSFKRIKSMTSKMESLTSQQKEIDDKNLELS